MVKSSGFMSFEKVLIMERSTELKTFKLSRALNIDLFENEPLFGGPLSDFQSGFFEGSTWESHVKIRDR